MSFESTVLEVEPLTEAGKARVRAKIVAGTAATSAAPRSAAPARTAVRRPRRRRLVLQGSAAGLAAAAVAGGFVIHSVLFPASAFASWTAVPVPTSISAGDARLTTCLASIPAGPAESVGTARQLTPVVAEERGAFTAALLGGGDSIAVCIFDDTNRSSGRTVAEPLPAGRSVSIIGNGGSLDKEGARYAYGRVGPGVNSVTVVTTNGVRVTASVAGGYYLAWWPSPAGPSTVTASDRDGTVLQELVMS